MKRPTMLLALAMTAGLATPVAALADDDDDRRNLHNLVVQFQLPVWDWDDNLRWDYSNRIRHDDDDYRWDDDDRWDNDDD